MTLSQPCCWKIAAASSAAVVSPVADSPAAMPVADSPAVAPSACASERVVPCVPLAGSGASASTIHFGITSVDAG
ncbi:hypothetical protein [Paraburkholderia bryophila]|uniref:Secreted protein n=1 Tax=Paraburkholderia bryophila TaxID=420952 RepID=A0A7Z0AYT7_9BURK|nr:hypothetical protein [Paraburkholderia bryophila]NYH13672.1 hypothetical protein [Paraburkholderia bryophila]